MERVLPLAMLRALPLALASLVCLAALSGCASSLVQAPKPPAQQDPFAGLPIGNPGEETPLEDVPMNKNLENLKVGLLVSGNTKATQYYADDYLVVLAGGRVNPDIHGSGNIVVTPVLAAVGTAFDTEIELDKWEDAKKAGVDLVALVDLTCHLPESNFHPAVYTVAIYMLTPDGKLLQVIRVGHSEESFAFQNMMEAQMQGQILDNAAGGHTKNAAAYSQAFQDDAIKRSGPDQTIRRGAKAVSRIVERKVRDFLDDFEESQAFANRNKGRAQSR